MWDDPAHLTSATLASWHGLWRIWSEMGATQQYYPVLHSAFWVEHRLWGSYLPAYHLLNICLHAGSACLLAVGLRRLWGHSADGSNVETDVATEIAAWLAAVIFVVHPVTVESVAWMSEQKNTLSLILYLGAALAYLRFDENRRVRWYVYALVCFVLAVGAKSTASTLPAALLVIAWWRHGRISWRRDGQPLLPFFGIAIIAGVVTAWVEARFIGAQGTPFALTWSDRLMLAPRVLWFYLGKDVWPTDLTFFYTHWDVPLAAAHWWPFLLVSIGVTAGLYAVRNQSRAPLAWWLLYVGALFPALGFFNVFPFQFSYVADHFQYLAVLVFAAAVAGGVQLISSRLPTVALGGLWAGAVAIIAAFATQAHAVARLYRDNETLFSVVIERQPDSWMAHEVLATTLAKSGRSAAAIEQYHEVIRINPAYPDAYHGLAIEIGKDPARRAESLALYVKALELRPHYLEAHYNYGLALAMDPARRGEAIEHLKVAVGLKPSFTEAQVALANLLMKDRATLPEALEHLETALRLNPNSGAIHRDYGDALARAGRIPDAVKEYETALRLNEGDAEAHFHLADVLVSRGGRVAEALPHYETALRLNPKLAEAHAHLAGVLAGQGRLDDAVTHAEAALKLKPDDVEGHNMLAILCAQKGDLARARDEWQKALAINPQYEDARQNLQRLEAMLRQRGE